MDIYTAACCMLNKMPGKSANVCSLKASIEFFFPLDNLKFYVRTLFVYLPYLYMYVICIRTLSVYECFLWMYFIYVSILYLGAYMLFRYTFYGWQKNENILFYVYWTRETAFGTTGRRRTKRVGAAGKQLDTHAISGPTGIFTYV